MKEIDSNWNWGPAFNRVRDELDVLIWLVAERSHALAVMNENSVASGDPGAGTVDERE